MKKASLFIGALILFFLPSLTYAMQDKYDIVLFWGQSNMTGYDTSHKNVGLNANNRIAYDYKYSTNSFVEINDNIKYIGELVYYNASNGSLDQVTDIPYSLQKSYGTNIIPQFVKTYNDITGRKVIAIMASNGGEEISHFLPHNQVLELSSSKEANSENQYIYEALEKKYKAAIHLIKSKGDSVGRQFYVVFQGEDDASNIDDGLYYDNDYYNRFIMVHNNLKSLGLEFGAIIETGHVLGQKAKGVAAINRAQQRLISLNNDIILGSDTPYRQYMLNSNINMRDDNIHFTANGLSEIGEQCAIAVTNYSLNNYKWLTDLKLYSNTKLIDNFSHKLTIPYKKFD